MNPEVQNVAPAPVSPARKVSYLRLVIGRGERIRTSGPCLPKTLALAAHGGFPWVSLPKTAHIVAYVLAQFRMEVHCRTLEHCLSEARYAE